MASSKNSGSGIPPEKMQSKAVKEQADLKREANLPVVPAGPPSTVTIQPPPFVLTIPMPQHPGNPDRRDDEPR